jgi:hypothetical protein
MSPISVKFPWEGKPEKGKIFAKKNILSHKTCRKSFVQTSYSMAIREFYGPEAGTKTEKKKIMQKSLFLFYE